MRMRDLEKASGVGRETIRFYIREGLLPEPVKASRNSAIYDEEHLTRLLAIRRLRDDRYLPLGVIRVLLDNPPEAGWDSPEILPHVDRLLRARMDGAGPRERLVDVAGEVAADGDRMSELVETGLVRPDAKGTISAREARIVRILNDLWRLGFTREAGYGDEGLRRYTETMRWLADAQVREFFARTGRQVDDQKAAEMAERGIGLLIALMGEIFTGAILERVDTRLGGKT
jgi:DNA-binding transcriptional MerR regulator